MKTVLFQFAGVLTGLVALSLLSAPAAAATKSAATAKPTATQSDPNRPAQPSESKQFGDWLVQCFPGSSQSPCQMFELLANKKTGRRVLGIWIAYVPTREQHVIQIGLPLGLMLSNGAVLSTDTFTSPVLKFIRCDMEGCYIQTGADNNSINALARATRAEMQAVFADGTKLKLPFSLNGFSAAHSALVELARQKTPSGTPATSTQPADATPN